MKVRRPHGGDVQLCLRTNSEIIYYKNFPCVNHPAKLSKIVIARKFMNIFQLQKNVSNLTNINSNINSTPQLCLVVYTLLQMNVCTSDFSETLCSFVYVFQNVFMYVFKTTLYIYIYIYRVCVCIKIKQRWQTMLT